jgi:ribonuclease HII
MKADFIIGVDEVGRAAQKEASHAQQYIIGIDEVGRGPLAGPVTVGLVGYDVAHEKIVSTLFAGIRDSKKFSHKQRVKWNERIRQMSLGGLLHIMLVSAPAHTIDTSGISKTIHASIKKGLLAFEEKFLFLPETTRVVLDGGLRAPSKYSTQETIIRGDESVPVIAAASIVAKVARDSYMVKLDKKYPVYQLATHKGYGTRAHQEAIQKHGLSPIHRASFCTRIVVSDMVL